MATPVAAGQGKYRATLAGGVGYLGHAVRQPPAAFRPRPRLCAAGKSTREHRLALGNTAKKHGYRGERRNGGYHSALRNTARELRFAEGERDGYDTLRFGTPRGDTAFF